ncbi:MAG: GntR family transcriptional regulator, partial [Alphaproteobacteria bacterium]|nr:GntR family transcriptional regulator [Alphaproteobacteria bacterium]
LGRTNVIAHHAILAAARKGDAEKVRKLMRAHIAEAESHVRKMHGAMSSRLVLDSEMRVNVTPRIIPPRAAAPRPAARRRA